MAKQIKLVEGHWYTFVDRGEVHVGYFVGRQKGFECMICRKGCNAYTFNIWHNARDYETWSYGPKHMPKIIEDLGERNGLIYE